MDNNSTLNKLIIRSAYIVIIVLIIAVIALLILKYNVEGERNMPFKLSNLIVISSAEGYQKEENKDYVWDAEICQYNDIYINIEKNKNYKEQEIIKSIVIDNIEVIKGPKIGKIEFFTLSDEGTNAYDDKYKVNDRIEYTGEIKSDIKNLKISNQGSTLIFRIVNQTGKRYTSNDETLKHNGKLLKSVGITEEQIKMQISFDLTINLETDISFKTTINLNLPVEGIIQEGTTINQIIDTNKFIFKRK